MSDPIQQLAVLLRTAGTRTEEYTIKRATETITGTTNW